MELEKQEHGFQNLQHMGDASGAHASTSTLHSTEPLTVSGKPRGGATQDEYGKLGMDEELQVEVLTFPEGEHDAVTITNHDMEGLQAGGSLSGNIIDFYTKYLQSRLRPIIKECIHIFNTYFFTKLVEMGGLPEQQRDAAYERVQRWAGNVNIFEKKFVFIPVHQSSHWSLIIICNLSSLTNAPDKQECPPSILHLDSVEGKHKNLGNHIIGYIVHAWPERHQKLKVNQLLALRRMDYVELKVPQQENDYDCGIYLVCFIELFLCGSLNVDFVSNLESLFTSMSGKSEVSAKRRDIENLIWEHSLVNRRKFRETETVLSRLYKHSPVSQIPDVLETKLDKTDEGRSEDLQMHVTKQINAEVDKTEFPDHQKHVEVASENQQHTKTERSGHPSTDEIMVDDQQQECVPLKHRKERRKRKKWSDNETSILLTCMRERRRFCKRDQATTNWFAISLKIASQSSGSGPMPTADQCRLRYDTLLKAYKKSKQHCTNTGKQFSELNQGELKLATHLTEGWYNAIDEICQQLRHKGRPTKHVQPDISSRIVPLLRPQNPPPPLPSTEADHPVWVSLHPNQEWVNLHPRFCIGDDIDEDIWLHSTTMPPEMPNEDADEDADEDIDEFADEPSSLVCDHAEDVDEFAVEPCSLVSALADLNLIK